jgi:adenosylcobinamide kinase/adenosylcobinamide-phosphate guanylyltransferase
VNTSVVLVLGGARSGKSAWAERQAAISGRPVLFVATAVPFDAEMAFRIAAHQATRPSGWRTVEEPLDLVGAVATNARPNDLVLVDCLTVWLGNLLHVRAGGDPAAVDPERAARVEAEAVETIQRLLAAVPDLEIELVVVSNEVGMGLVPPYPVGRVFRDVLGRVNCVTAAGAGSVVLMVAGLPVDVRRLSQAEPVSLGAAPKVDRDSQAVDITGSPVP